MKLDVLYEDNHLIAVYKPSGMLVQGDHSGDPTLIDEVKYFLKQKYNKPGNVFLGMLHRLDRPACGIVLFAKTSKGAARLSEQFRSHTIQKIYHALVEPKHVEFPNRGILIHYLKKDSNTNVVHVYERPTEGALKAELSYEVVHKGQKTALVKVHLKTGRPHQIRAQLASIGLPIVGDVKYGASHPLHADMHHAIALCATTCAFTLPTKDEQVVVEVAIPDSWPL